MRRTYLLALTLTLACAHNPAAPSRPLDQRIETDHFVFQFASNDRVDTAWQEAYHAWAVAALQVNVTRKITYNKYFSRAHMGEVIGVSNTNGFANVEGGAFELHSIWPSDNHEAVHLYSLAFGRTVALFSEGLAVAYQVNAPNGETEPKWNGTPLHTLAKSFRQQGRLASLTSIVDSTAFRTIDPNVSYPEAGSFVRFLIDTYGLDTLKRLYAVSQLTDSGARASDNFLSVYGMSLVDAERAWWAMLDARP